MCMLSYFPAGIVPETPDALANGVDLNPDGHGYAIVAGSRLIVRHSMAGTALLDRFMEERAQHPSGPALFHSRISTAGTIDLPNCHPFRIGRDKRTVVAHNGVLPESVQPVKGDRRSDTRIAAQRVLPTKFGHLGYAPNRRSLEKWVGSWNKLAIVTTNPMYGDSGYLINERSGVWAEDGAWHSNYDYLGGYTYSIGKHTAGAWSDDDLRCDFCGDLGRIDVDLGYCTTCGTCIDCGEFESDCQCFMPDKYRTEAPSDYADWWAAQMDAKRDEFAERLSALRAAAGEATS